jgi:uncharacterized peroxidase-related enzyme
MIKPALWIAHIAYEAATGRLRQLYERIKGPDGNVDNIMLAHSLRPHTMEGHMALYKNVLHHTANQVPKAFLEMLGVYVSSLNSCAYCVEHHFAGLKRLMADDGAAAAFLAAAGADAGFAGFPERQRSGLAYARTLTRDPGGVAQGEVQAMRDAGWSDGEILEINQVVAYFAYANRTVLGLGVSTTGDLLGLSPSGNGEPDDWAHR